VDGQRNLRRAKLLCGGIDLVTDIFIRVSREIRSLMVARTAVILIASKWEISSCEEKGGQRPHLSLGPYSWDLLTTHETRANLLLRWPRNVAQSCNISPVLEASDDNKKNLN